RFPVHPVQPVSVLVLPWCRVVLADGRDRPHPAVALAEPAALRGGPGQRVDPRRDHQRAAGAERPVDLHQPERVGDPDPEQAAGQLAPAFPLILITPLPPTTPPTPAHP